ncbi:hypothetical protein FRC17_005590 [Serendipita sp. 399]|nr:hypothetical protein FRC17_005590 [Serendipita sp. 399]
MPGRNRWLRMNEAERLETNEEPIFAFALSPLPAPLYPPPLEGSTIRSDPGQSQQQDGLHACGVITSTPPLWSLVQNPFGLHASEASSLGLEFDSDSTLFTTQITPISCGYGHSYGAVLVDQGSLSDEELAPSPPFNGPIGLPDVHAVRIREEGFREEMECDDIFGATWASLQHSKGTITNEITRKSQRRFFFQNPVSSRPPRQESMPSSVLLSSAGQHCTEPEDPKETPCWTWVPSFPDAHVPNHRAALAPLKSQLRNSRLFLGSEEPLVTRAAIEDAVSAASSITGTTALVGRALEAGADGGLGIDSGTGWEMMEGVDCTEPENVSNHVRTYGETDMGKGRNRVDSREMMVIRDMVGFLDEVFGSGIAATILARKDG